MFQMAVSHSQSTSTHLFLHPVSFLFLFFSLGLLSQGCHLVHFSFQLMKEVVQGLWVLDLTRNLQHECPRAENTDPCLLID